MARVESPLPPSSHGTTPRTAAPTHEATRKTKTNNAFVKSLTRIHLDQVFSWIAEGARDWYAEALGPIPVVCQNQMDSYVADRDTIAAFCDGMLTTNPTPTGGTLRTKRTLLYKAYEIFCDGDKTENKKVFYAVLRSRKYGAVRVRGVDHFRVRVKSERELQADDVCVV